MYVDGTLTKTLSVSGDTYTLVEEDLPLDYESCCGYFLNEGLTETIENDTLDLTNGDVNIYTKTAAVTSDTTYTLSDDGTYYSMVLPSASNIVAFNPIQKVL